MMINAKDDDEFDDGDVGKHHYELESDVEEEAGD